MGEFWYVAVDGTKENVKGKPNEKGKKFTCNSDPKQQHS